MPQISYQMWCEVSLPVFYLGRRSSVKYSLDKYSQVLRRALLGFRGFAFDANTESSRAGLV